MLSFILFFITMKAGAIICAYTLTPTSTAKDLKGLSLEVSTDIYVGLRAEWMDLSRLRFFYLRRLLFAEFIRQNFIMRHITSGMPLSYVVATLMVQAF